MAEPVAATADAATHPEFHTPETVVAYISEHSEDIGYFDQGATLTASVITGGNVNFAFRIAQIGEDGEETGKSVFFKQAPEYVAIFGPNGLPLTSLRMKKEHDVYIAWQGILGDELSSKYLPKLHHFDEKNMIFVMEFFEGFTLLDHELVGKGTVPSAIATGLAEFMGKTHAATHSHMIPKENADEMAIHYENRPMRDIQVEYVFTKCYREATHEQLAGLTVDEAFKKEIEMLKRQYDGDTDNLALCHGDLHPGSVMVNPAIGAVKVIDPEFTCYGPPGLDAGCLLSGYVLATVHQAYSNRPECVASLYEASVAFWEAYKSSMINEGVPAEIVDRIEVETVGFTVAEVCRTALGFAGGRLWLQFDCDKVKKASVKAAMRIVQKCIIGRHAGGIQLLFDEIKALTNKS